MFGIDMSKSTSHSFLSDFEISINRCVALALRNAYTFTGGGDSEAAEARDTLHQHLQFLEEIWNLKRYADEHKASYKSSVNAYASNCYT